jgi:DNA-binding NarL/FixJ family response regulator
MTTPERHHTYDVITMRADLDAAHAEIVKLRAVLTSTPALEALLTPPEIHVIDQERDLTARELETLKYLTAGCSNDDIALAMYVSRSTVKTHLVNLFSKLGVHTRTGAAIAGIKLGLRIEEIPCVIM